MSNVGNGGVAGNVGSALEGHGKWDEVAQEVGSKVSKYENQMIEAFSLAEGNLKKIQNLADKMNYSIKVSENNAKGVLETLQIMAKNRYERAQRSMAMLVQIISNAHSALMRVIQNIRAN